MAIDQALAKINMIQTQFPACSRWFTQILIPVLFVFVLLARNGVCAQELLTVRAGNQVFVVEVADSAAERKQGLMGRDKLETNQGLLMVFPRPQRAGVWMKGMRFSLDVAWLSSSGRVVDIQTLQPCILAPCPIYRPKGAVRYILEVGAGLFPLNKGQGVEILDTSRDSLLPSDLR